MAHAQRHRLRRRMETPEPEKPCAGFFCEQYHATNPIDRLDAPKASNHDTTSAGAELVGGTSNGNANTNAPKPYKSNVYSDSATSTGDERRDLIAILLFGCLVLAAGIYYLTRAILRRRLYSHVLRRLRCTDDDAAAAATTTSPPIALGTVIQKESRNIWEFRWSEYDSLAVIAGITPMEEVYQPWPVAPFHLVVCYEAPMAAAAVANPSSAAGSGNEVVIKKLENVSKKRFMNTRPGDLFKILCLEGKPRSGMIQEEVQFSSAVALEDMVLWAFLLLVGVGLCAWGIKYTGDTILASVPTLVAVLCLLISINVHKAQCHVLEEKLIDGKHNTSKIVSVVVSATNEEEESSSDVDGDTPEPNEPNGPGEIV